MLTYIICALIILLSYVLWKRKLFVLIHLKQLLFPVVCLIFLICLIIFSKSSVTAAARGINLWLETVFPSLFPFFVASELLNGTGFIRAAGVLLEPIMRPLFNVPGCGSFAYAMGITSGYPVGAKITAGMRTAGLLTKGEAERLLAFTNNSGPLFIVGAVSTGMFGLPGIGIFMLFCHIAACTSVGILFRFYGKKEKVHARTANIGHRFRNELNSIRSNSSFGSALGDAVKNSISLILAIGGYIILFSVIITLLLDTGIIGQVSSVLSVFLSPLGIDRGTVTSIISGFFEITTGTKMASLSTNASIIEKLVAASMIIGWAGLSVHTQVISVVKESGISIKPYLLGKLLQGIISGFYTWLGLKLFGGSILGTVQAFAITGTAALPNWKVSLLVSCTSLVAVLAVLAVLYAIFLLFSKLKVIITIR